MKKILIKEGIHHINYLQLLLKQTNKHKGNCILCSAGSINIKITRYRQVSQWILLSCNVRVRKEGYIIIVNVCTQPKQDSNAL